MRITLLVIFLLSSVLNSTLADIREVVIFQTSDIHSHIFSEDESGAGLLRLATLIQRRRSEFGRDKSLLIDCGDLLPGTVVGSLSRGRAALESLNFLKYDVWVPGNHDFEFSKEIFLTRSAQSEATVLAANLEFPENPKNLLPWRMFNVNGAKIAVFGATSPFLDKWLWRGQLSGFKYFSIGGALDKYLPVIMDSEPDMIIMCVHHGLFAAASNDQENNLNRLAERYPQIDLFLGGHTHQNVPGRRIGPRSWYVEAGKHGERLIQVTVKIDTEKHCVREIKSHSIELDKTVPENNDLKIKLSKFLKPAREFCQKKFGETVKRIDSETIDGFNSSMSELFGLALTESSSAKIALHGSVISNADLSGEITGQEIFNTAPFEDTICVLQLNLNEMKTIISEQIQVQSKGRFQAPWGIKAIVQDNKNIKELNFENGESWSDPEIRIPVAFNSYVLAGAGSRFPKLKEIALKKEVRGADTGITVRSALIKYISNNSPLNIRSEKRISFKTD